MREIYLKACVQPWKVCSLCFFELLPCPMHYGIVPAAAKEEFSNYTTAFDGNQYSYSWFMPQVSQFINEKKTSL